MILFSLSRRLQSLSYPKLPLALTWSSSTSWYDTPCNSSVTETHGGICFKFIEVLLSTNAVSSKSSVFSKMNVRFTFFFQTNESHHELLVPMITKAEKLQFDKDLPKRKLFWIFIPETSLRTAVFLCISLCIWVSFLGPTSSASTCQWYPRCSVKAHRCRKRNTLPILF